MVDAMSLASLLRRLLCGAMFLQTVSSKGAGSFPSNRGVKLFFNASAIYSGFDPPDLARAERQSALCSQDGTVVEVGSYESSLNACKGTGAKVTRIDLHRRVVFPGFIDAHFHLLFGGLMLNRPKLHACNSPAEVVQVLKSFEAKRKEKRWLRGFGWDHNRFPGKAFPTRIDLDAAFPTTPVWLDRIDGHAGWANTAALHAKGVHIPERGDVPGGRIVRSKTDDLPTGVFTDRAMNLVLDHVPPPSSTAKRAALYSALRKAAEHGVTGIHDPGIDAADLQLYKDFAAEGKFTLRSDAMVLGVSGDMGKGALPSTPKLVDYKGVFSVRGVKFFMDGALGSWGAAMLQPYSDKPGAKGELRISEETYRTNVSAWLEAGYQVATHAIGDRANRIVLNTYRDHCLSQPIEGRDLRLRIEHFQIVNVSDIPRLHVPALPRATCILASMQPTHATSDATFALQRLGEQRIKGAYAWKSALKGTTSNVLAFGSDWPTVGKVPPLLGIFAAVTRQSPGSTTPGVAPWGTEQCVSRAQALKSYTIEGAYASFREREVGRLDVGMKADLVVLDRDIASRASTPHDKDIIDTHVYGTFLAGVQVWQSPCWSKDPCPPRDEYVQAALKEALLPMPTACS